MEIICILCDLNLCHHSRPEQEIKKTQSAVNILNLESILILNCYHWQFRKKFKCIEILIFTLRLQKQAYLQVSWHKHRNNVNLSFKQTTVSYCWKICIKFKCLVLKYSQANFDRMSLPDFKIMMKQQTRWNGLLCFVGT